MWLQKYGIEVEENITVKEKLKDLGEKWKLDTGMEVLEWCVTGNLFQDDDMEPLSGLSFEFGISVFLRMQPEQY